MSFCGRKTYIDANGKCHNISGMKVNEIKNLVNKTLEQVSDTSTRDVNNNVFGTSYKGEFTVGMKCDRKKFKGTDCLSGLCMGTRTINKKDSTKCVQNNRCHTNYELGNEDRHLNINESRQYTTCPVGWELDPTHEVRVKYGEWVILNPCDISKRGLVCVKDGEKCALRDKVLHLTDGKKCDPYRYKSQ